MRRLDKVIGAETATVPVNVPSPDATETTPAALGSAHPAGVLVVQDGLNKPARAAQNVKIIDWRAVEAALGAAP